MPLLRGPLGPCLLCLLFSCTHPAWALPMDGAVFINEFHYDNAGTDSGEFIELAGVAGTDLSGWQLLLYNGSSGALYNSLGLAGTLGDDTGTGFGFWLQNLPSNGLQNGAPDGIALVDDAGLVREFLSYEGVFTAVGGAADGLTSVDIGVSEPSDTPPGYSLQRTGSGWLAADFRWQGPASATPGAVNTGQVLAPGEPLSVNVWPLWLLGLWWVRRHTSPS